MQVHVAYGYGHCSLSVASGVYIKVGLTYNSLVIWGATSYWLKYDFRVADALQFFAVRHGLATETIFVVTITFPIIWSFRTSWWWCNVFSSAWLGWHLYRLQKWRCRNSQGILQKNFSYLFTYNSNCISQSWWQWINKLKIRTIIQSKVDQKTEKVHHRRPWIEVLVSKF